jgi:hypothetical protein
MTCVKPLINGLDVYSAAPRKMSNALSRQSVVVAGPAWMVFVIGVL